MFHPIRGQLAKKLDRFWFFKPFTSWCLDTRRNTACRVRFITWNTSKSVYLISKHWNWVSKRKKKTHERQNQGIKADFEVRVSDIQSSLTKVCFISSSSYATCTSPTMHLICPPKFCISIVFNFSWDGCNTQEKWKTKVMQNFGGQIRCIMGVSKWRMDNYNEYEKTKIKTSCKPLPMYT